MMVKPSKIILERFCSIYKSANPRNPSSLKELIQACITKEENEVSCRIPVGDEIKKVKWSMNPLKAPGSTGFLRLFHKHYWDEIRGLVILAVQSFYRYIMDTQGAKSNIHNLNSQIKRSLQFQPVWFN